jgi:hypothetical protein
MAKQAAGKEIVQESAPPSSGGVTAGMKPSA